MSGWQIARGVNCDAEHGKGSHDFAGLQASGGQKGGEGDHEDPIHDLFQY
jgi:hypothetical protein